MEDKIYTATVSQVNRFIRQMMDKTSILRNIWVKGEISNFKLHYSGHMYLTLKDDGGVLKSVMFKSNASHLCFAPENGMKVLARGRISVYERDGAYQLYIEEMQPDGIGALHIAYEQLKAKLAEEGLFDPEFKKPIPRFPETVGVITATTGAAVRDIINVLGRRYPYAKILIYPSLVQGEGAAQQVAQAIAYFNQKCLADVLIVGRGGGSIEDLWAFNEEVTARAIFASKIPVISAVGHETDFTIADFVADLRAPTPSAAAELAVPSAEELTQRFASIQARIVLDMGNILASCRADLRSLKPKSPQGQMDDARITMDQLVRQIVKNTAWLHSQKREKLRTLCGKLDAMSPLGVLKRGYGIAKKGDGSVAKSVEDLPAGECFELVLSDGSKICQVQ